MSTPFFPRDYTFSITTVPECAWWLDSVTSFLALPLYTSRQSIRISVAPLLPEDPVRSRDWQVFGNPYGKVALHPGKNLVQLGVPAEAERNPEYLSAGIKILMVAISTVLLPYQCLFLHAATLVRDGQAVLVAASSGGGKSTTARRVPPPWSAPGDENCRVVPDGSGGYLVHVLPTVSSIASGMRGLFWDTTLAYPVRGVCILKKGDEDRIEQYPALGAAICMTDSFRQASQNQLLLMDEKFRRMVRQQSFEQACTFVRNIPVYLLNTTLTGTFWEVIGKEMF